MTEVYQFKAALAAVHYTGTGYDYSVVPDDWIYIDLDILNFGHLIDLVSRTHNGDICVANKQKFFDKFEIEIGENIGSGGGNSSGGGFNFGGTWNAIHTISQQEAVFSELLNCTLTNNVLTPTATSPQVAFARDLIENAQSQQKLKFTWPTVSPTDTFLIGFGSWSLGYESLTPPTFNDLTSPVIHTHMMALGYVPDIQQAATFVKAGAVEPAITLPTTPNVGDEILLTLSSNTLTVYNITQEVQVASVNVFSGIVQYPMTAIVYSTAPLTFYLDATQPLQQQNIALVLPSSPNNKTYQITNADETSVYDGTPLKLNDFVTFYNDAQNIMVTRLYTETQINTLVNTALEDASLGNTLIRQQFESTVYSILPNDHYAEDCFITTNFQLMQIEADAPCRVRIYASEDGRNNDTARAFGTAVDPDNGMFVDVVITTPHTVYNIAPSVMVFSESDSEYSYTCTTITNLDVTQKNINLTLTYVNFGIPQIQILT